MDEAVRFDSAKQSGEKATNTKCILIYAFSEVLFSTLPHCCDFSAQIDNMCEGQTSLSMLRPSHSTSGVRRG